MELQTYGKSTGFCIDPIEKKPLNHFLPGTATLSFGTAGCNLGCKFCQNWDISKSKQTSILSRHASPEEIVRVAKERECRSISFTYNDPVIWAEYAIATAIEAKRLGLKTCAVSAGYITPEARGDFFEHIDAVNIDLKSFSESFYRSLTLAELQPVLETLLWLKHETDVWLEITNLIIPGQNDSFREIEQMCTWISDNLGTDVPLHFSAFHPDYKMRDLPRTPPETLTRARAQAKDAGLEYVYVGNVQDTMRQSTNCPKCSNLLIERTRYAVSEFRIQDGACGSCGHTVAGVFEDSPGTWGEKRELVTLGSAPSVPQRETAPLTPTPADSQIEHAQVHVSQATTAVRELAAANQSPSPMFPEVPETNPRMEFKGEQFSELLHYTYELVVAAIEQRPAQVELSPQLAAIESFGLFVSIKRGEMLRACRGYWGDPKVRTLQELLHRSAPAAATLDPRFPSLTPSEIPFLSVELSLMYDPEVVQAKGLERLQEFKVGTHGVAISHPSGRGLLLPQVAANRNWNAKDLLEQVCRKARLPIDTWHQDQTQLLRFRCSIVSSRPRRDEIKGSEILRQPQPKMLEILNAIAGFGAKELKLPSHFVQPYEAPMGIYLEDENAEHTAYFQQVGSLLQLLQHGVQSLKDALEQEGKSLAKIQNAYFLNQPITLQASDYPQRHATLGSAAILGTHGASKALLLPEEEVPQDKIPGIFENFGLRPTDWPHSEIGVLAYQAYALQPEFARLEYQKPKVREAAFAGNFYPQGAEQILENIARLTSIKNGIEASPCQAVLLPHAGWKYCADIIVRTLAHIAPQRQALIIGPKHTPRGAHWSLDSHAAWRLPHVEIPTSSELVSLLSQASPQLVVEPEAHIQEHGTEVILPLLHALNPDLEIAAIALGHSSYEELEALSDALLTVIRSLPQPPLLVISSDMNHFADEQENRRLDSMALEALETCNAKALHTVCTENKISMCGMQPAVAVLRTLEKLSGRTTANLIDYQTSARVSKDQSRVVGYAGMTFRTE